ncbi:MAG: hypothetical protein M2R45_01926 [Verrucomicrobia subdivision 3 bacterium]|nr:hypothetical protein [Limisphaerales bacterium]MCS1416208.1 hypothetical protein [Limisphaerales bacterium]
MRKPPHHPIETVRVSDRFGDSGTVGLLITVREENTLAAETFLMSCRGLGKRIEQNMVRHLALQATSANLNNMSLHFRTSAKNQPIKAFYDSLNLPFADMGGESPGNPLCCLRDQFRFRGIYRSGKTRTRSAIQIQAHTRGGNQPSQGLHRIATNRRNSR